jgi:hypothetical protein
MAFLPDEFEVPTVLETERFRLRPLTIHDVVKDSDAVMTSRDHLWALFGEEWGWPPEDLTLEQDLDDLGWHQKEFERRSSFDYAVVSLDERRVLGCVYVDPPTKAGFEAEVYLWARTSEVASGLEEELLAVVREWIDREWPFATVAFPGREIDWETWRGLPDPA